MKVTWQSGNAYDYFMGRWSKQVAVKFLDWLAPDPKLIWVDIGCGSGVLSESIIDQCYPKQVIAIDQSEGFVQTAQQRLGQRAVCKVGDALSLPIDNDSTDLSVSALVLNFIPDPVKALNEMKRITRAGGTIAAYVWDYAGKMEFLKAFWDAAIDIDTQADPLHESHRFSDVSADYLEALFRQAHINQVETTPLEIETRFSDFDDFWQPFLGGQGPAPSFVQSLSDNKRNELQSLLRQRLQTQPDGSISLLAQAWGIKGWL